MRSDCLEVETCPCSGCTRLKRILDDPDFCDRTERCDCRECDASRSLMERLDDRTRKQDEAYDEEFGAWLEEVRGKVPGWREGL